MTEAQVLVEVERSGMVESRHRGHVVVVDDSGSVVGALGDPDALIYPRSAVKPFQAVGMLELGLDFEGPLLALSTASHSGEPFHVAGVLDMLARSGLGPDDLQCPPDLPYGEQARIAHLRAGGGPQRVLMNCSGKHAAMLRVCVVQGWDTQSYLTPEHPLQKHLHDEIAQQIDHAIGPASTDGCGAPLWALPLSALASGFVRLADSEAGSRLISAVRQHPEYFGGTGRDITQVIGAVPGLMAKDGAEAVQAMTVEVGGRRYGVALKIEDGAQRARSVAAAAVLAAIGVPVEELEDELRLPVPGGDAVVGAVRPTQLLTDLAVGRTMT